MSEGSLDMLASVPAANDREPARTATPPSGMSADPAPAASCLPGRHENLA
jgi:hypothetical protein